MSDFPQGARSFPGAHSGGTLLDGPPRVTWHITWDRLDPRPTFDAVAAYLVRVNFEPTILWNPEDGDIIGLVPASRSAYAVRNLAGGVETNRYGRPHVQIEVFFSPGYKGRALFTDGPLVGLDRIMSWLDELAVPRVAACDWNSPTRSTSQWLDHPGHFGHFAVPENDHDDPIRGTNIALILSTGQPVPHQPEEVVLYTFVKNPAPDGRVFVARHGEPAQHVGDASFGFDDADSLASYQGDKIVATTAPLAPGSVEEITDAKGATRRVLVLNSVEAREWFGLA